MLRTQAAVKNKTLHFTMGYLAVYGLTNSLFMICIIDLLGLDFSV